MRLLKKCFFRYENVHDLGPETTSFGQVLVVYLALLLVHFGKFRQHKNIVYDIFPSCLINRQNGELQNVLCFEDFMVFNVLVGYNKILPFYYLLISNLIITGLHSPQQALGICAMASKGKHKRRVRNTKLA